MSELFSKSNDGQIQQNGLIMSADEVIDYLNTSNNAIGSSQYENAKLQKENKRLKERNDELATALEEGLIKVANYQKQQVTLRKLQEKVKSFKCFKCFTFQTFQTTQKSPAVVKSSGALYNKRTVPTFID